MSVAPEAAADSSTCVVLGAGSWGTALAIQLARVALPTLLWGRDSTHLGELQRDRRNARYLPDAAFPEQLRIEPDLKSALQASRDVIVAVPSHALRGMLEEIAPHLLPDARVAWATKGFEVSTGLLPHQVAREVLGESVPTAVISGPTFAKEVGAGLPTAMTIAASDPGYAAELAQRFSGQNFRAYTSTDITGVEVGGAIKNVMAIGAGISDGLGFGANTRIALIARGLVEMTRLGVALGAKKETFMGLAGLGDLVLTCTDNQSRNRRFGLALASGEKVEAAQKTIGQVVEGVLAANAVRSVAQRAGVEMPICEQVYRVVYEGVAPKDAVKELMSRALKPE
ncbi:glycerol-3-phosphate dehydrogenase [NAD(P)+] [Steroidobacter agaridevorans]|uniref:Glycerol-3-phosphate dehydrogenase [NAD(P)+] n=1 Tax=Steroidobacter agaridevorans TaxID=2695856 RepID=A0A829Y6B6_9GAMM|nr:NAD(P)H-dependent glycerol-3-phosphate dehydrogenase [Steroidobacter agaridevorans]GFE78346.1 glycerol-3-phosphate dehydrogenase [NAD(P)+] [Steroidobacter agaridevorans]GFE89722.1 glycerol-3-phosphate dehydrogenase [NAD(P)+] [Steroidobacter agaridevorans]